MYYIENARVVLEDGIIWDGAIVTDGPVITAVGERSEIQIPENAERMDAQGRYVGPGFVDIHVHGGGGYHFYENPEGAAEHFLSGGETTILPTLYYDLSRDEFAAAIDTVRAAMENGKAAKAIAGFYMEGPYMNPKYGARPEMNKWKGEIRREDYSVIVDRAGKYAKVWAVAPEREGLEPFMEYAKSVNPDVVFAVGHSEATPAQIKKLKKYGIRLQTHCMDATGRVPTWEGTRPVGPDEACMLDPDMYAEMICDSMGIHVCSELQRQIVRTKGLDRVILITDSFVSEEESPENLRHVKDLVFDPLGRLNGSRLTLNMACRNLMHHTNCGIAQAFRLASSNPAKAVGLYDEVGSIEPGKKANLVFTDDMFNVDRVMLEGRLWK